MPSLLPAVDPDGLLEYSVVYTDRAVNHMSRRFQGAMNDISAILKEAYGASAVAVVPGSGTFAMEAVARQFATGKRCLVIRNGWFSYRWTQIFEAGDIPAEALVLKARRTSDEPQAPFAPVPVEEVVATIREWRPDVVFAPHVETASGMLLPDDYVRAVAAAVHEAGGLFVLDCIASGALWVDMRACGVDVLDQRAAEGLVGLALLRPRDARRRGPRSSRRDGQHQLRVRPQEVARDHAGLRERRPRLPRHHAHGWPHPHAGRRWPRPGPTASRRCAPSRSSWARGCARSWRSAASRASRRPASRRPSVVVVYTDDDGMRSGAKFAAQGLQTAAGVPLQCDEPADFMTFRLGLFGLDKLHDVERTVGYLEEALDAIL